MCGYDWNPPPVQTQPLATEASARARLRGRTAWRSHPQPVLSRLSDSPRGCTATDRSVNARRAPPHPPATPLSSSLAPPALAGRHVEDERVPPLGAALQLTQILCSVTRRGGLPRFPTQLCRLKPGDPGSRCSNNCQGVGSEPEWDQIRRRG